MKKIVACVLALAALTAFVSCAGGADKTTSENGSSLTSSFQSNDATHPNSSQSDESSNTTLDTTSDTTSADRTESSDDSSESVADSSEDSSLPPEDMSDETSEETTGETSEETSEETSTEPPYVFEQNGILFVGTRGLEMFYGSDNSIKGYSQTIQKIKQDLGDGVNVYSMVCPHASVYYAPATGQYSNLLKVGKEKHDLLKQYAGEGIIYVDVYNVLSQHTKEEIYFRTEHHWAALGAYYAAKEFARLAGTDFLDISEYEEHVKPGFVGTLYSFSGKAQILKDNPEDVKYYENKKVEYTAYFLKEDNFDFNKYNFKRSSVLFDVANYAAFLGSDGYGIKIVTNNNTGRTLLVLKDSYGNAVVPFLLSSFDTIYAVDYRYFKRNCVNLAKEVGATDVLVIASGFTAAGTIWKRIEAMRTLTD
jgi:hypothetical protein